MLVFTFIDLPKLPGLLFESNSTEMIPVCPGSISSVDQLGAVHPQPAFTFNNLNDSSPVLEKLKSIWCGPSSSFILPKSNSNVSNSMMGCDCSNAHMNSKKITVIIFFIYIPHYFFNYLF